MLPTARHLASSLPDRHLGEGQQALSRYGGKYIVEAGRGPVGLDHVLPLHGRYRRDEQPREVSYSGAATDIFPVDECDLAARRAEHVLQ